MNKNSKNQKMILKKIHEHIKKNPTAWEQKDCIFDGVSYSTDFEGVQVELGARVFLRIDRVDIVLGFFSHRKVRIMYEDLERRIKKENMKERKEKSNDVFERMIKEREK